MNKIAINVEKRFTMLYNLQETFIGTLMERTINEMLKSYISVIFLSILKEERGTGYQVIKKTKNATNGMIKLKELHYYSILSNLITEGKISLLWEEKEGSRGRYYFSIEEKGIQELKTISEFKLVCRAFWKGINTPLFSVPLN
jgi:DNA-binding PadR family transcriptional regulator